MSFHLEPCPSCSRHARADSAACPFCGVAFPESFHARPVPVPPPARANRGQLGQYRALGYATIAAYAVTTVASIAACDYTASSAYGIAIDAALFVPADGSASSSSSFHPSASAGASTGSSGPADSGVALPASCSGQTFFVTTGDPLICDGQRAWFLCNGTTFNQYSCQEPGPGWTRETTAPDVAASSSSASSSSRASASTDAGS